VPASLLAHPHQRLSILGGRVEDAHRTSSVPARESVIWAETINADR